MNLTKTPYEELLDKRLELQKQRAEIKKELHEYTLEIAKRQQEDKALRKIKKLPPEAIEQLKRMGIIKKDVNIIHRKTLRLTPNGTVPIEKKE